MLLLLLTTNHFSLKVGVSQHNRGNLQNGNKMYASMAGITTTTADDDDYDYRSILLWLSCGCFGVFIALRLLKCLLNKSERQSEQYRISRQQAHSVDDDLKASMAAAAAPPMMLVVGEKRQMDYSLNEL